MASLASLVKPPPAPQWQAALAQALKVPLTPQTTEFFNAWHQAEGGRAGFNPFNTTQPAPGASSYNSVGVRNYPSLQAGVNATAQTLENGRYGSILADLHSGAPAGQLARDVAASPWGTGSGVSRVLGSGVAPDRQLAAAGSAALSPGGPSVPSAPAGRLGGSSRLAQLVSQTDQMVGLGSSPALASLLSGRAPTVPAALVAPSMQAAAPGGVTFQGDTTSVKPQFLASLGAAVKAVGGSQVRVTSGFRSPQHNAAVGGVPGSNHTTGDALDGEVLVNGRWVPLGAALLPVAQRFGLRSGAVPGFFNGRPDPVHVDDGRNQR